MTLVELLNCLDQFFNETVLEEVSEIEGIMRNRAPGAMCMPVSIDGHDLVINKGGITYTITPEVK